MQKGKITDLRSACMGHVGTPAFLPIMLIRHDTWHVQTTLCAIIFI